MIGIGGGPKCRGIGNRCAQRTSPSTPPLFLPVCTLRVLQRPIVHLEVVEQPMEDFHPKGYRACHNCTCTLGTSSGGRRWRG